MSNKPEQVFKVGPVRAPVFRNEITHNGRIVYLPKIVIEVRYKDKSGEWKEETDWHNIVAWGKLGEICAQYLAKGRQAYVEGQIRTRSWEDREGKKRTTTEIIANEVVLLGARGEGAPEAASRAAGASSSSAPSEDSSGGSGSPEITDDDIPF